MSAEPPEHGHGVDLKSALGVGIRRYMMLYCKPKKLNGLQWLAYANQYC